MSDMLHIFLLKDYKETFKNVKKNIYINSPFNSADARVIKSTIWVNLKKTNRRGSESIFSPSNFNHCFMFEFFFLTHKHTFAKSSLLYTGWNRFVGTFLINVQWPLLFEGTGCFFFNFNFSNSPVTRTLLCSVSSQKLSHPVKGVLFHIVGFSPKVQTVKLSFG